MQADITKKRTDINEIESRKTTEKIIEKRKSNTFWKTNKMDQPLVRLTKIKIYKKEIPISGMKEEMLGRILQPFKR